MFPASLPLATALAPGGIFSRLWKRKLWNFRTFRAPESTDRDQRSPQAGPGGRLADATAIVTAMKNAGYRLPTQAPYAGPGSTEHGNLQQVDAALAFFSGKSRN